MGASFKENGNTIILTGLGFWSIEMGRAFVEISVIILLRERVSTISVMDPSTLGNGLAISSTERERRSSQMASSTMAAGSRAKNADMVNSTSKMEHIIKANS